MRGQQLARIVHTRNIRAKHETRAHLYQLVKVIVKKLSRGDETVKMYSISRRQRYYLTKFYGITRDPGPRVIMQPFTIRAKRPIYYPRPVGYRSGSPIWFRLGFRRHDEYTTAELRSVEKAWEESGLTAMGAPNEEDRAAILIENGWVDVVELYLNPELRIS